MWLHLKCNPTDQEAVALARPGLSSDDSNKYANVIPRRARPDLAGLQGYLAHKKTPTPLGPS